jgi:PAS domain S-box-containing protein
MTQPSRPPRTLSRVSWAVWLLALVSAVVAFRVVDHLESERIRLQFEDSASTAAQRTQRELRTVIDDLYAVRELFDVAERIDRLQFAMFVQAIVARHPSLTSIAWAPRIRAPDLAEYARRAREDGLDLVLKERDEAGALTVAAAREEYYPIYYFKPRSSNELAFGIDVAAGPRGRAALSASRDSGLASTVGPFLQLQRPNDPSDYLVPASSFGQTGRSISESGRRESFDGVVVATVRLSSAIAQRVDESVDGPLEMALMDGGRVVTTVSARDGSPDAVRGASARWSSEVPIELADRELVLRVRALPGWGTGLRTWQPVVVATGGGLLCATLGLYFRSWRREHRARAHARKALRESEHRYRTLVENAPEAVVVYDADSGCFVDANAPVEAVLNVSRERLLASRSTDSSPRLQPDGRESSAVLEEIVGRALLGETVVAPWNRVDDDGNETPFELRLTRLPYTRRNLVRCSMIDVRERWQSELRQLTMAHELDHRVKNTLAMVLSIAEQTCASARSIEEFREAFVGRIRALARAHEALAARSWHSVPLAELAHLTFQPYVADTSDRAAVRGTSVRLSPAASSCPGMALHELAANAAKYGALSDTKGRVDLHWAASGDGDLAIEWTESAGRRVVPPTTAGFGSRLLKGVLSHELGGHVTLEYRPWGVHCRMTIPGEHWTVEGASGA